MVDPSRITRTFSEIQPLSQSSPTALRMARASAADILPILSIAVDTELFSSESVDALEKELNEYVSGSLGGGHQWVVAKSESELVAAAHYAPEAGTSGTWNLHFFGVRPQPQGTGVGTAMAEFLEQNLQDSGARLMVVESSGLDNYRFYLKQGFTEAARIKDFYKSGDDRVFLTKSLPSA